MNDNLQLTNRISVFFPFKCGMHYNLQLTNRIPVFSHSNVVCIIIYNWPIEFRFFFHSNVICMIICKFSIIFPGFPYPNVVCMMICRLTSGISVLFNSNVYQYLIGCCIKTSSGNVWFLYIFRLVIGGVQKQPHKEQNQQLFIMNQFSISMETIQLSWWYLMRILKF